VGEELGQPAEPLKKDIQDPGAEAQQKANDIKMILQDKIAAGALAPSILSGTIYLTVGRAYLLPRKWRRTCWPTISPVS
jgi:hypothetical protein